MCLIYLLVSSPLQKLLFPVGMNDVFITKVILFQMTNIYLTQEGFFCSKSNHTQCLFCLLILVSSTLSGCTAATLVETITNWLSQGSHCTSRCTVHHHPFAYLYWRFSFIRRTHSDPKMVDLTQHNSLKIPLFKSIANDCSENIVVNSIFNI